MRLLIDANVILDVLQNREPHVKDSSITWKLCETRQAEGFISALTFANLVCVMRKKLNPEQIEEVLQNSPSFSPLRNYLLLILPQLHICSGMILKMPCKA